MPEMPEGFKLDSGFREDMVISIHSAYFAPDAAYMEGRQLMLWLIGTDENDDPVDVRMSVGADWQTDDGNVITHPTKKSQNLNKNSVYGHFLEYAFEIPALAKILEDRSDALDKRGSRDARIWLDLIIHLENRTIKYGGTIPDQERLMPTEYLGTVLDTAPNQPTPQPTPSVDAAAILAQARAQREPAAVTNGSPLYLRAIELARESSDFATFLGKAFGDDEILADDELAEQCADEKQVWATVHPS